jgi:hypothetical protein
MKKIISLLVLGCALLASAAPVYATAPSPMAVAMAASSLTVATIATTAERNSGGRNEAARFVGSRLHTVYCWRARRLRV